MAGYDGTDGKVISEREEEIMDKEKYCHRDYDYPKSSDAIFTISFKKKHLKIVVIVLLCICIIAACVSSFVLLRNRIYEDGYTAGYVAAQTDMRNQAINSLSITYAMKEAKTDLEAFQRDPKPMPMDDSKDYASAYLSLYKKVESYLMDIMEK